MCKQWNYCRSAGAPLVAQNVPKFSLANTFKLYTENDPRNPHTGQRDRTTFTETIQDASMKKKLSDLTRKTNLAARHRRYWWVHSIIAHHPRTTNLPSPTQNNHESKWQNQPQRTTSRPWLFYRHADTRTKILDKKWTMDVRGKRYYHAISCLALRGTWHHWDAVWWVQASRTIKPKRESEESGSSE